MYEPSKVADKINLLLKEKNKTQKTMLEDCGLNKNAISTMLSRASMPKADNLAKIADYLDCSVDYLLGRTDKQTLTHSTSNINSNFVQSNGSVTLGSVSVGSTINNSSNNISLSEEETEILNIYRSLNIREKAKFLNMALDIEGEKSD